MNNISLLKKITVLNRDNGEEFTIRHRLSRIEKLLKSSEYTYVYEDDLFYLYAKEPIDSMEELIVVTSHVDCHKDITRCYSEREGKLLHGTYDNSITNAAIVSLMMEGSLPSNVVIAFTGDEEVEEGGAIRLIEYLNRKGISYRAVVLDVTDEGLRDTAFSIENNFWGETFGRLVIFSAEQSGYSYMFVPFEDEELPQYASQAVVSENHSAEDEAWTFDQYGIECFSLCIPVYGEMHDDSGLYVERWVYEAYIKVLRHMLTYLTDEATVDAEDLIHSMFGMVDDIFDEEDDDDDDEDVLRDDEFIGYNEDGDSKKFTKLVEFDAEGEHYLAYTDDEHDENGNLHAYGSRVVSLGDGSFSLNPITDERVWNAMVNLLNSVQEGLF